MLSPKKAIRSAGVASSLVVLLIVTACGRPDAAPRPSPTVPTISTSTQVSPTPVPSNDTITVKPTTGLEPTVEATTQTSPPAPPPPPPPVETTDPPTERTRGPFVQQGAACPVKGAIAVNRRFRPMVCMAGNGGKLRWQPV